MAVTHRSRLAVFAIAALLFGLLGVRSPSGRTTPWAQGVFKGEARLTMAVETLDGDIDDTENVGDPLDVFVRAVYSTEASDFEHGLLVRATFPVPNTDEVAVVRFELDRHKTRVVWDLADEREAKARYYVYHDPTSETVVDTRAVAGELELDDVVVTDRVIAFRIRGWVELVGPGPDGVSGTNDDTQVELTVAVESTPTPEDLTGAIVSSPLPGYDYCEPPECYVDPDYSADPYYDYYDPSCGYADETYYYDDDVDDGSGCEGDTVDDDLYYDDYQPVADDGSDGCSSDDGYDDSGCNSDDSYDDGSGCDGGDYDTGDGGGCDGGDEAASCADSCEGDTLASSPSRSRSRHAGLGWLFFVVLLGGVLRIHRDDR